ncbi:MAG: hypothetical protein KF894_30780 [Labilithrix sp.]|nr:hypothetical protein [Labilithrix sp.]
MKARSKMAGPTRRGALVAAGVALGGVPLLVGLSGLVSSCAVADDGDPDVPIAPAPLPEAGATDGASEAGVDGGCVASDPACVTTPISCDEAAWCPVATPVSSAYPLTAVWGSSKTDVWAAGSGGTVIHWDGAAWKATPPDPALTNTFRVVTGSGAGDVWVAAATDLVFHSDGFQNGTAAWTRVPSVTPPERRAAPIYAGFSGAGGLMFGGQPFGLETVARANLIVKKPGAGPIAWEAAEGTATVNGLWAASADDVWLVGDNSIEAFGGLPWQRGFSAHGTRVGDELVWTPVESQASVVLRAVWGSSASDVWAVGDKGTVRHVGAGGAEWNVVGAPTRENLRAIWGAAANDVWAVGELGTILHWDGATWKASVAAFPVNRRRPHLYGVWGSGPKDVWIVGDGIALRFTGGAK